MSTFRTVTITALALAATAQVWAAEAPRTTELAQAKQNLARKAGNTTGAHRQELWLEQRKLQSLIDDLQSGKRVDPAEIDRVLRNAEHDAR